MTETVTARRGRPRRFDTDEALDAAMRLFWARGYEATSMSDLVEALGMNRASIYAAFGDKETLYLTVLERYGAQFGVLPFQALTTIDDPKEAIAKFLSLTAEHLGDPRQPRGCLVTSAIIEGPVDSERVARTVAEGVARLETTLYDLLRRAQAGGALPPDADPRALARYFVGVSQGMSVMAKLSPDASVLRDIARSAMAAWPRT